SQTLGPRPSSAIAPSIWYDAVAEPQRKSSGKRAAIESVMVGGCPFKLGRRDDRAAHEVLGPQLEERRRGREAGVDRERTAIGEAAADVARGKVPVRSRRQL